MPYTHVQLVAYEVPTLACTDPGDATSDPFTDDQIEALSRQGGDQNEDAALRVQRLVDVADWARRNAGNLGGADTLKVFIAPEFYFRAGLDGYDEVQAPTNIFGALMSAFHVGDFEHWLIVAGSTFWNAASTAAGRDRAYFNTVNVVRGGPPEALNDDDRESAVPVVGGGTTNQKAIMSPIDYQPGNDRRDWDGAVNPDFKAIIGDWAWRKGHLFQVKGINHANTVMGRLVDGDPITFGLEVCLEHGARYADLDDPQPGNRVAEGVLRGALADWEEREGWDPPAIDVHLLTCCGMPISPANVCARDNGYVMRCDGHPAGTHSQQQQKTGGGLGGAPAAPAPWTGPIPGPLRLDQGAIPGGRWFAQRIVSYARVPLP